MSYFSCNDGDEQIFVEAVNFFENLLQILQNEQTRLYAMNHFIEAQNMQVSIESIRERYFTVPQNLYGYVRDTISFEREILDLPFHSSPDPIENMRILSVIQRLEFWIILSENVIQGLEQYPQDPDVWNFMRKLKFLCDMNEVIFVKIISCLNRWKMHQKTFKTDPPFEGDEGLVLIQRMYQDFTKVVATTRNFLSRMVNIGYSEQVQELSMQNWNLFGMLINESIFFDVQPPQVLRTKTM